MPGRLVYSELFSQHRLGPRIYFKPQKVSQTGYPQNTRHIRHTKTPNYRNIVITNYGKSEQTIIPGELGWLLLLFYVHDEHLWSCRDLTTLFLSRLRSPKRSAERETKVCGRTGTSGSWVRYATDCATRPRRRDWVLWKPFLINRLCPSIYFIPKKLVRQIPSATVDQEYKILN